MILGFLVQKCCFLPLGKDQFLGNYRAVSNDLNSSHFGNFSKEDIGANPSRPSRTRRKGFSPFNDRWNEEPLWDCTYTANFGGCMIVFQQNKVW